MKLIQLFEEFNTPDELPMQPEGDELPMDDEARMIRADKMGFNTSITYYHGSPDARGIYQTGFEPKYGAKDSFFYFTPDRRIAATYADDTRAWDYQGAEAEVLRLFLRWKNPTTLNWGGHNFRYQDTEGNWQNVGDSIAAAKAQGRDVVIVRGISDEYGGNGKNDHGRAGTIVVVFDPRQIRSTQAAFDPRKNESPMIMET